MRKLTLYIAIVALFCVACASTLSTTGKLLGSTATTVDEGMKGWATYVVLNKPPIQQENAVRDAYSKYQASMLTAKIAYATAAAEPTNTAPLDIALKTLDASRIQLLLLIQSFSSMTLTVTTNK
jgi:hypothetical protein